MAAMLEVEPGQALTTQALIEKVHPRYRETLVDALDRGEITPIGLGRANGRYFTFHTGMGFDAAVVRRVEQRAALKRWAGHPLFVMASLRTWALDYRGDLSGGGFVVRPGEGIRCCACGTAFSPTTTTTGREIGREIGRQTGLQKGAGR